MFAKTLVKIGHGVLPSSEPDDVLIKRSMDVEPILDMNHEQRESGILKGASNLPIARIPSHIMADLYRRGIGPRQDPVRFKRWLETNWKFKTTNKKMWRPR